MKGVRGRQRLGHGVRVAWVKQASQVLHLGDRAGGPHRGRSSRNVPRWAGAKGELRDGVGGQPPSIHISRQARAT